LAIINQSGHTNSAAKICDDYTAGGYTDWYLPAIFELRKCFDHLLEINQVLGETNGFEVTQELSYWSSTESNFTEAPNSAWYCDESGVNYYNFNGCNYCRGAKNYVNKIRAVRKF
jgi:hypothetical protein